MILAKIGKPMTIDTHPDNDIFDKLYPPATDLPMSIEYTDVSEVGRYGKKEQDLEILLNIDPSRIWSIIEGENDSMFAVPGIRRVNFLWYFVSENPRPSSEEDHNHNREYQLLQNTDFSGE